MKLLLEDAEHQNLRTAALESGMNMSFVIFQALEYGLRKRNLAHVQSRRSKEVCVWIPTTLKNAVAQLSKDTNFTQQSLLRLFLRQYLQASPWKRNGGGPVSAA